MADKQYYLIKIYRMNTSDEADVVPVWSGLVEEENLDKPFLPPVIETLKVVLTDAPLKNIRPMTLDEIAVWRTETDTCA